MRAQWSLGKIKHVQAWRQQEWYKSSGAATQARQEAPVQRQEESQERNHFLSRGRTSEPSSSWTGRLGRKWWTTCRRTSLRRAIVPRSRSSSGDNAWASESNRRQERCLTMSTLARKHVRPPPLYQCTRDAFERGTELIDDLVNHRIYLKRKEAQQSCHAELDVNTSESLLANSAMFWGTPIKTLDSRHGKLLQSQSRTQA